MHQPAYGTLIVSLALLFSHRDSNYLTNSAFVMPKAISHLRNGLPTNTHTISPWVFHFDCVPVPKPCKFGRRCSSRSSCLTVGVVVS
ncbi:hypothetical protein DL96DRAFT_1625406 [Flagelloscypha sp. PMI_526]|nr:hypothetical protein DL96DRAFT_1625406 [Flagelloscypha sp. PMI_526]